MLKTVKLPISCGNRHLENHPLDDDTLPLPKNNTNLTDGEYDYHGYQLKRSNLNDH